MTPRCWASRLFSDPCDGVWDKAHLGLSKQTLRKQGLDEQEVWSPAVWRPVCRKHHQRLDGPWYHLTKDQLPSSVLEFARTHHLEHLIDQQDERHRATEGRRAA